jgi:hypothetical protein
MNYELENNMDYYNINDMTWDDPATPLAQPVQPVIDPNGWHWYPDANDNLFTLYFDADGNECMMWLSDVEGSFYWRCAGVGYTCRDIGIEDRKGIFFRNLLVGTMILDEHLTVVWLPETYIPDNQIQPINDINTIEINWLNNINFNINDIDDIYDSESEEDDTNDP